MIVDASIKSKYPKLANWVRNELPKVVFKPRVWRAFLKYSELSAVQGLIALTPWFKPILRARAMPGANGEFDGANNPDVIYLADVICARFETDYKKAQMLLLVESTILHETVHWGDWKDGVDQAGEEGKAFEVAAYGRDINRYW
jgi:hypothetical protein